MFVDVGLPTRQKVDLYNFQPGEYPNDGYPSIIRDARHEFGCETAEQIETAWLAKLRVEPSYDPREIVPYINRGRWLMDCPACNAGNYVWDGMPSACCLECGRIYKVLWQPPLERARAIRFLAVREVVNQNWNAHKGETVETLEFENRWYLGDVSVVKNGVRMPSALELPGSFVGRGAVSDRLG